MTPAEETVQLEEFVVSGIRGSITKAIDVKRSAIQMVDSIVAEDIGKFPDNNVVESLQRVPGIQVTDYARGEIAAVTIRGMPDASTLINGRNVFTASGRAVALADIPASLLSQVDVYKTRSASMIETGLAGQINVITHRPFDFAGDKVVIVARGIYQEQADKIGPNLSALYSKRWNTNAGKIGALINVSYAKTEYRDQSVTAGAMVPFITDTAPPPAAGTWVPYERIFLNKGGVAEDPIWTPGLDAGLPSTPGSTLTMNGVGVPYVLARDAIFASDATGEVERPAASFVLQYAPNNTSEYAFEAFYDGYRNENFNSLLFSFADWWGGPLGDVNLYPGTNIVKSRELVSFPYAFNSGDLGTGKTDSYVYALNAKWDITPDFKLRGDLSYQTSEFNSTFFAMRTDRVAPSLIVDFNSGSGLPAFSFPDDSGTTGIDESNLTDPRLWNIADLYDNANRNKGSAGTLTLDGDYNAEWGAIKKLSFGVRHDVRKASEAQRNRTTGGLGQNLSTRPELMSVNSGFFDGRSAVPTSWVAANGYYIRDHADEIRALYGLSPGSQLSLVESFNVKESTSAGYLQADFLTFIGGHKLDGQFGTRYVTVDTDINFGTQSTSVTKSKLLPSFMIRYDITDNLRTRFSYGETLRRPNFGDLNPVITYNPDVTNIGYGTATGGNPNLKPTESKNYDLALEYYFSEGSAVFATAFKRKIDGLVVGFRKRVNYQNYDYILSQPDNASNGELEGVEIGAMYFPKTLPGFLQGFGIQASYTMLDSEQDLPITDSAGQVIGTRKSKFFAVSDSSYNAVLAYERSRFSARLSYAWREGFLHHNEAALFANPLGVYNSPEKNMNLQFSYKVTDNLVVTLEGTNLTDEIYQSHYGDGPGAETTNNFGSWIVSRTVAVGVRYSF